MIPSTRNILSGIESLQKGKENLTQMERSSHLTVQAKVIKALTNEALSLCVDSLILRYVASSVLTPILRPHRPQLRCQQLLRQKLRHSANPSDCQFSPVAESRLYCS